MFLLLLSLSLHLLCLPHSCLVACIMNYVALALHDILDFAYQKTLSNSACTYLYM